MSVAEPREEVRVRTAEILLAAGAVKVDLETGFTFASGLHSPMYVDNRTLISHPAERDELAEHLGDVVRSLDPAVDGIAGVATAGIPWGAWVASILDLPMVYVRSKPKDHGTGQSIEGDVGEMTNVAVIEDLISTGGSSGAATVALREAGLSVAAVVSIFSYGMPKAVELFSEVGVPFGSLSGATALADVLNRQGRSDAADELVRWHRSVTGDEA